jgi:hypothetical protein
MCERVRLQQGAHPEARSPDADRSRGSVLPRVHTWATPVYRLHRCLILDLARRPRSISSGSALLPVTTSPVTAAQLVRGRIAWPAAVCRGAPAPSMAVASGVPLRQHCQRQVVFECKAASEPIAHSERVHVSVLAGDCRRHAPGTFALARRSTVLLMRARRHWRRRHRRRRVARDDRHRRECCRRVQAVNVTVVDRDNVGWPNAARRPRQRSDPNLFFKSAEGFGPPAERRRRRSAPTASKRPERTPASPITSGCACARQRTRGLTTRFTFSSVTPAPRLAQQRRVLARRVRWSSSCRPDPVPRHLRGGAGRRTAGGPWVRTSTSQPRARTSSMSSSGKDGPSIDQIVISADRNLTMPPGARRNDATILAASN